MLTVVLMVSGSLSTAAPGEVYLVLGSDTAIWEGMDTSRYHCHYNIDLYTNQTRNAYQVMDPAFRSRFVDSYGQTVKLTWWMMAGQIFRYADNTDVPVPNIMTLHLMNQYHGAAIQQFGDELTLHYHTFAWTNYSGGTPSWVQANSFLECRDDFDFAMAQFLLEEEVYPVSFRSGWEWMSNEYQNHLNLRLPFSLEANWWTVWGAYHPSTTNYRVAGDGKGWNARCIYMANISQTQMNTMFAQAAAGTDQLACIWAHLPETDFLTNITNVDAKAQLSASNYPSVKFRYCTAVEAMQRWLKATNEIAPQLTVTEEIQGEALTLLLQTDKPIFQEQPFVACKDIYKQTSMLSCRSAGTNAWRVTMPLPTNGLSKVGIALTDDYGNLTTRFLHYADIPEPPPPPTNIVEVVVDNTNATVVGAWLIRNSSTDKYGPDYCYKVQGDGAAYLQFTPNLTQTGNYQVCEWHPQGSNRTTNAPYVISFDGGEQTVYVDQKIGGGRWNVLGTYSFAVGTAGNVKISDGFPDAGQVVLADAVKFVWPNVTPPLILSPPLSRTIKAGDKVDFFVLAAGTEPLAFQWRFNGANISEATSTSYSIQGVLASNAGTYSLVVSNAAGTTNSSEAILTVIGTEFPPTVTSQPQNQTVPAGTPATFSVAASGPPPLSYQWFFNAVPISGATATSYAISSVQSTNAGTYSVTVSNVNGTATSSNAVLTVIGPAAPTITSNPESQTVIAGSMLALNVAAAGSAPLSYQWRVAASALAGATNSSLVISPVQPGDAGTYDVIVSNPGGSATSATAVVTVVIVPAPQMSTVGKTADGQVQIGLSGNLGNAFLVEASTNLINWLPLTTTAFGSNALLFADPDSLTLGRRFFRGRGMITFLLTDFEPYTAGVAVMFQNPAFSGSTSAFVDTAAPNFARVTNSFPAGHTGSKVLQVTWTFKTGTANWLRMTATDGPIIPNPTVDFRQGVQFDVFTDRPMYFAVGLRETSTTAPLGGNGGYGGLPIEWVGGTSNNTTSPPRGRLVPAGEWTTLRFFFPHEPIRSFTGNGRLDSTTGKGVLEELALVPADGGTGAYNLYLDNFQVIFIEP